MLMGGIEKALLRQPTLMEIPRDDAGSD